MQVVRRWKVFRDASSHEQRCLPRLRPGVLFGRRGCSKRLYVRSLRARVCSASDRSCVLPALSTGKCGTAQRLRVMLAMPEKHHCQRARKPELLLVQCWRVYDRERLRLVFEMHSGDVQGRGNGRLRSLPERLDQQYPRLNDVRNIPGSTMCT